MSQDPSLSRLLARIRTKIEGRTNRPWYDLQRDYFFKDQNGIKNLTELRKALEHYHVLLSDAELVQLMNTYPSQYINAEGLAGFDFKSFSRALYPQDKESQGNTLATSLSGGTTLPPLSSAGRGQQPQQPASLAASQQLSNSQEVKQNGNLSTSGNFSYTNDYNSNTSPNNTQQLSATNSNANTNNLNNTQSSQQQQQLAQSGPVCQPGHGGKQQCSMKGSFKGSLSASRRSALAYTRRQHPNQIHTRSLRANKKPQDYPAVEFRGHGEYPSPLEQPRFNVKPMTWFSPEEMDKRKNLAEKVKNCRIGGWKSAEQDPRF